MLLLSSCNIAHQLWQISLSSPFSAAGIACSEAHSRSELRAEAAVLHDQKPLNYRFSLCESFYRYGQCSNGIRCEHAHGIDEVRYALAICCMSGLQFLVGTDGRCCSGNAAYNPLQRKASHLKQQVSLLGCWLCLSDNWLAMPRSIGNKRQASMLLSVAQQLGSTIMHCCSIL